MMILYLCDLSNLVIVSRGHTRNFLDMHRNFFTLFLTYCLVIEKLGSGGKNKSLETLMLFFTSFYT